MSMKEIDNKNIKKSNETRDNVYIIHTTQNFEHNTSKPTTTREKGKGINKFANDQTTSGRDGGPEKNTNFLLQESSLN